jgi:Fur family ferric uptake transcriptional regulator
MKGCLILAEQKYKTKQRDEILNFFINHPNECFSAREVYHGVSAGEATVFRALTQLTREGKLRRFTGDSGRGERAYYQYQGLCENAAHIHLKCAVCGTLIHMDCDFMEEMIAHFRAEHKFSVDCGKTVIYGMCNECCSTETTEV